MQLWRLSFFLFLILLKTILSLLKFSHKIVRISTICIIIVLPSSLQDFYFEGKSQRSGLIYRRVMEPRVDGRSGMDSKTAQVSHWADMGLEVLVTGSKAIKATPSGSRRESWLIVPGCPTKHQGWRFRRRAEPPMVTGEGR